MSAKTLKVLSLVIAVGMLAGCQLMYDTAHEDEERRFCDSIENRNAQKCAGNHAPDLPPF